MKPSRKQRKNPKKKKSKVASVVKIKSIQSAPEKDRDVDYVIPEYILTNSLWHQTGSGSQSLSVFCSCSPDPNEYTWCNSGTRMSMSVRGCLFVVASMPVLSGVTDDTDLSQASDTSDQLIDTEAPQQLQPSVDQRTTVSGRRNFDRLPIGNFSVTSDGLQKRENYPSDAVYEYVQEQLKLNEVRTGLNLVSPERTEHILHGDPKLKTVVAPSEGGLVVQTVQDWSGGHSNPQAAQQYKKTQKPFFWTDERFMYEISDILISPETNWTPQGDGSRYVCVEERSGVPIKLVAEIPDDGQISCVTAYPAEPVLRIKK
ncbi:MAG: hypothetical protein Q4G59_10625 [Planctomycetia bacterium]|nr:hypothetical protein [Planctomycetia bacterium]